MGGKTAGQPPLRGYLNVRARRLDAQTEWEVRLARWGRRAARAVVVMVSVAASGLLLAGTGEAAVAPPAGKVFTGVTVDGALGLGAELDAYTGSAGGKRPAIVMDYRDWAHAP